MARGRPLARAAGVARSVSTGIASFMDFKRSFEDAVRKRKWEKERDESERVEKRYTGYFEEGGRPSPEDRGAYLAGGYPQLALPPIPEIPGTPPGMIRTDTGFATIPESPEVKAEKERWKREKWGQEQIEGRYGEAFDADFRPSPEDMGTYLAGGNVPMIMPPAGEAEAPEGYEEVPKGKKYVKTYSKKPTKWEIRKEARTTINSMLDDNIELQTKVYENPGLLDELIGRQVERLEKYYLRGEELPKAPAKRENPYKQWYPNAYWSKEVGAWVVKKREREYKLVE